NRPEVLDDAVLSRVMLRLSYPHLDSVTRSKIWSSMFDVAGLRLEGLSFDELGKLDINGRLIRNLTRLAKILFPDGMLTRERMNEALRFGCGLTLTIGSA